MSTCTCAGQVDFRCPEHGNLNTGSVTGLDADLATLREALFHATRTRSALERAPVPGTPIGEAHLALDRVEAEVARLRQEEEWWKAVNAELLPYQERAVAAEREVARLTELHANAEQYAKEGWHWLGKALEALGAKTVFDIEDRAARVARLREGLLDFEKFGTRFDCNPTVRWPTSEIHVWWVQRATEMDRGVRERARALLAENGAA